FILSLPLWSRIIVVIQLKLQICNAAHNNIERTPCQLDCVCLLTLIVEGTITKRPQASFGVSVNTCTRNPKPCRRPFASAFFCSLRSHRPRLQLGIRKLRVSRQSQEPDSRIRPFWLLASGSCVHTQCAVLYVLLNPFRVLVTVNVPSCCAESLIQ